MQSCVDRCTQTIRTIRQVPVYVDLAELRLSFAVMEPQSIVDPGKIALYGDYLFVVDRAEGIHIIDNSNPSFPKFLKYIRLQGCYDVSIKGTTLYANNGPDLVLLDISNLDDIRLTARRKVALNFSLIRPEGYIYKYEEEEVVEVLENVNCNQPHLGAHRDFIASGGSSSAQGSMSRFAVVNDYLYVVDYESLISFDIRGVVPQKKQQIDLNQGEVETITATDKELFIGTTTGMIIYNYVNNPEAPQFVSVFAHSRACDPVVVKDSTAYITTKSGNFCGWANDQLLVVNVRNSSQPQLLAVYPMESPNGLGIDQNNTLFICDDVGGLKIFNADNPLQIDASRYSIVESMVPYDVILSNNLAIVSAENGVYQYDYSDPRNPTQLSILYQK